MNRAQPSRGNQQRRTQAKRPAPVDIWRVPGPLPEIEPIVISADVGALLKSLGDPPMNAGAIAGHYFNAVVERSLAVARALAYSANVLAEPDND